MPDAVNTVLDDWHRQRPDLDFQPMAAVARLMRLSRLIDKEIKDFLKGYDLEPGEFDILTTVRRSGATAGMTTSAFHKTSLVTAGAITNRLDRMAAKGLIERIADPADRRVIRIVLTPHGTELIDTILGAHLANYARLLEPLDGNETDQFVQTLRKLLENLETDAKPPHRHRLE